MKSVFGFKTLTLLLACLALIGIINTKAQTECGASEDKWTTIGLSDYNHPITDIAVHPSNSSIIYAGTKQHLLKTTNCGNSWDTLRNTKSKLTNITFYPDKPDTVIATTDRIIRSNDAGATWHRIDTGISYGQKGQVQDIAMASDQPEKMYVTLSGADSVNLFRTLDGGASWSGMRDTTRGRLQQDLSDIALLSYYQEDRLFVSTKDSSRLLLSKDGGESWRTIGINSDGDDVNYLASEELGIRLSLEDRGTFEMHYNQHDSLVVDERSIPDSVRVVNKIFRSNMGSALGEFIVTDLGVYELVLAVPASNNDLESGNTSWDSYNRGLPHTQLGDVEADSDYIFASLKDTLGSNGIFIRLKPVITDIEERSSELSKQVRIERNYPNPFNPSTNIRFSLPQSQQVTINVYNTIGQKIETLINRKMTAGSHSVTFDAEGLPSGVYIYRLKAREYRESNKMLLVK